MRTPTPTDPESALKERIASAIATQGYCVLDELSALELDEDPAHREAQLRAFAAAHRWSVAIRNNGRTALFMVKAQPWLSRYS